ncbi:MAG: DUF3047 domain-containing protein [Pseudomonadales bacterium]
MGCTADIPPSDAPPTDSPPSDSPSIDPVQARASLKISNAMSGWLASGIQVARGDELTLFGSGVLDAEGLKLEPRHLLWYRIGADAEARNFSANQETFTADADGEIFLTLRPLGVYWPDSRGTYPQGFAAAPAVPVDFRIDIVRFQDSATAGLQSLAGTGDTAAAAALSAIAARKVLPPGFEPLSYLSRSNVWGEGTVDGRPGISAETSDDVEIVKKPLDIPLTPDTVLSFQWRYDALPARGPETEAAFHDYLSIALEFDNGQDLTWMWSSRLAEGTHFGCPLPWWDSRETHFVLQSGEAGLGDWFTHSRKVLEDYDASIKVERPTRIVGVWFIANSLFARQRAAASFAEVTITNPDQKVEIF